MSGNYPTSRIRAELDALIAEGASVVFQYVAKTAPPDVREELLSQLKSTPYEAETQATVTGGSKGKRSKADTAEGESQSAVDAKDALPKPFVFESEYQAWYSKALVVVQQLMPDRYAEFRDLYRVEKRRELDVETYGICDAIQGLTVTVHGAPVFDTAVVTMTKLHQQFEILRATRARLDSLLTDLKGVLEAGLLDDELSTARDLLRVGHLRSAGVVGGVVLERHLRSVMDGHQVSTRRKPTLANLNDALKDAGTIDVPVWRQIQHVADVRNLCAHSAERDPTVDEVRGLLDAVDKIVKTVF